MIHRLKPSENNQPRLSSCAYHKNSTQCILATSTFVFIISMCVSIHASTHPSSSLSHRGRHSTGLGCVMLHRYDSLLLMRPDTFNVPRDNEITDEVTSLWLYMYTFKAPTWIDHSPWASAGNIGLDLFFIVCTFFFLYLLVSLLMHCTCLQTQMFLISFSTASSSVWYWLNINNHCDNSPWGIMRILGFVPCMGIVPCSKMMQHMTQNIGKKGQNKMGKWKVY